MYRHPEKFSVYAFLNPDKLYDVVLKKYFLVCSFRQCKMRGKIRHLILWNYKQRTKDVRLSCGQ